MSGHNAPYELNQAPFEVADPGSGVAIPVTRWNQIIGITVAGTETNTLADPAQAGWRLTIMCVARSSGTRTVTADSAVNASGHLTIAFDAVDERVILESVPVGDGAYEWRVVDSEGATIA
jgi:hypothetical protein